MNLFVAGTDTGIGKTVTSCVLALKLEMDYWKPVQSGFEPHTDTAWVREHLGADRVRTEAYALREPLSPHRAAELEGVCIDLDHVLALKPEKPTIIEGAGGVLTPLNSNRLYLDLIEALDTPTVVVARTQLGTINHTLLTLQALRERKIEIAGVVMVGELNPSNKEAIEHFGRVPVWGTLPPTHPLNKENLIQLGQHLQIRS